MCLVNFSFDPEGRYKLVIAANRDEFYERPTAKAHFWEEQPNLLAGRDLRQKGTWLGITKEGRIAALTNYRDPEENIEAVHSRGDIVKSYLTGNENVEVFLAKLREKKTEYAGFNLLAGTPENLWYYSNRQNKITKVTAGVHSLSNAFLNTSWPKTKKGRANLQEIIHNNIMVNKEELFSFLMDDRQADVDELPNTGVSLEWERMLSSMFIKSKEYGTRSSTVLIIDNENQVQFAERTYKKGEFAGEELFEFTLNR